MGLIKFILTFMFFILHRLEIKINLPRHSLAIISIFTSQQINYILVNPLNFQINFPIKFKFRFIS
jgi:hypothetical protein